MDAQELDEKLADLRTKVDESFVDEVKHMDSDALKEKVVQMSKQIEDIDLEKAKNVELRAAKTRVSDLNGGFRDRKKVVDRQRQYALLTLQERGSL